MASASSLLFSPSLGCPIPDIRHAVSCSLPTVGDVIRYEEKDAATLAALQTGYPRFVLHPLLRALADEWRACFPETKDCVLLPVSSPTMAGRCRDSFPGDSITCLTRDGITCLCLPEEVQVVQKTRRWLQRVGGFLSSRKAEQYLAGKGLVRPTGEAVVSGEMPETTILTEITFRMGAGSQEDAFLTNSGMNAFAVAYHAARHIQQRRGRNRWARLGWLYVDTIGLLEEGPGRSDLLTVFDQVHDLNAVRQWLKENRATAAGLVVEAPTNPLMEVPDLRQLHAMASEAGVLLMVDPSVVSSWSVDISDCAHIVTCSLTKYTASEGDVMAGALALTETCPFREEMRAIIRDWHEPLFEMDARRLAWQIGRTGSVLTKMAANLEEIVPWLDRHPGVETVYWPGSAGNAKNYAAIARGKHTWGGLVSFTLKGDWTAFYDRVPMPKGPSFGMSTTLLSPYLYLAHYDLVTSEAGRHRLARAGLTPGLMRLSIGTEPADIILSSLEEGLRTPG